MSKVTPTTIEFFGGAGTVTGSKHLLTANGRRVLLDCGLFQGLKELRTRNWDAPPFDPHDVDAVVLSHAHIDHVGYLPVLMKRGFHGPVYCTPSTSDLLEIALRDAAHLQEEQAEHMNWWGYSKHQPALPLFTRDDAEAVLKFRKPVPFGTVFGAADGVTVRFRPAGHILGSATVELGIDGKHPRRVVFSGDLGRWNRPILPDPEFVPAADFILAESTYGGRYHPEETDERVAEVVRVSAERGAALLVPAFAVGRTQELLFKLRQLEDEGRIPSLPVYVDSPMAIDVTDLYLQHSEEHDLDMQRLTDAGLNPLRPRQCEFLRERKESVALNNLNGPIIIISASGMATGGRILHHLKLRLPSRRTTVLLVGFQAAGTRGRLLQEGATEMRIHGQDVAVRAQVENLDGLSAHADQGEILRWLSGFEQPPRDTYLVHGEPQAATQLADAIRSRFRWQTHVALDGGRVELGG